jgi:hypothetical protein
VFKFYFKGKMGLFTNDVYQHNNLYLNHIYEKITHITIHTIFVRCVKFELINFVKLENFYNKFDIVIFQYDFEGVVSVVIILVYLFC